MTEIFNKAKLKEGRRFLRHNMPKVEAVIWTYLKNKQVYGQRFLRQYSIETYGVDFYCPKLNLAIEIDGTLHITKNAIAFDRKRQDEIESLGIHFLRFTNDRIFVDLNGVLDDISIKVKQLILNPPAPPVKGGHTNPV